MVSSEKAFSRIIKKKISIIKFIMTCLIVLLLLIIVFIVKSNDAKYTLINIVGRQRMLTQMISKDANRKELVLRALESGNPVDSKESLLKKVDSINSSLRKARDEFEYTYDSLSEGLLKRGDNILDLKYLIRAIDLNDCMDMVLWEDFKESINIIIGSDSVNAHMDNAVIFINSNNDKLLTDWDKAIDKIISNYTQNAGKYLIAASLIFIILLLLFFISLRQLNKYLVDPLSELYNGIHNFGLINFNKALSTRNEITPVINEINSELDKLNKFLKLMENLNKNFSFDGILNYIYLSFSEYIPYSHIGVALLKDEGRVLEASYGISAPVIEDLPKRLVGIRSEIKDTSLENIITKGTPRVINDLDSYEKNENAEYNKILRSAGIHSSITLPLKINEKPVGVIFFSSIYKNIYKTDHIKFLETLSNSISISLNKNIFIDELLYSTLLALTKMAESRDEDTGDHLERMKEYTVKITEFLVEDNLYDKDITVSFLKDIERFSPMHDIGKVGVRDSILLKPGKLTPEEFNEMKNHAVYGAEVLRTAEGNIAKQNQSMFKMGIEIAEGHHEKWDGTGYPYGKKGSDIPLSARIVAVADVFDALTSKRPYKESYSFDYSFDMIAEGRGKHFDPNIIDSLIDHKDEFFELYIGFKKQNFFYAQVPHKD